MGQIVQCQKTWRGPLSHMMLEGRRLLKKIKPSWLNVAVNTRIQITVKNVPVCNSTLQQCEHLCLTVRCEQPVTAVH